MSKETTRQMPGEVFFDNLSEINEGALLTALDKKMADLVAAVLETGNNGTLHTDDPAQGKLDLDAPVKVTFPAPAAADADAGMPSKVSKRA